MAQLMPAISQATASAHLTARDRARVDDGMATAARPAPKRAQAPRCPLGMAAAARALPARLRGSRPGQLGTVGCPLGMDGSEEQSQAGPGNPDIQVIARTGKDKTDMRPGPFNARGTLYMWAVAATTKSW